ncbi:MAG TPA: hypothetical protein VN696_07655 [Pyrinomonadaceae bacterium]|nr:hypothetical protein [Pyrinomonadaceae bacterium]
MQPKHSKYDTNPLDENVADRATDSWGRDTGSAGEPETQNMSGAATREIGGGANDAARNDPEAEAATRRIDDSYPSIFVQPKGREVTYQPPPMPLANIYQPPPVPPPQIYQRPPVPFLQGKPGTRTVTGVNISEKWANALPYFPFFIGLVASVVELLMVPRTESRTRFHAAQGFALQIAILAISAVFSAITAITDSGVGSGLFRFAAFVFLIVSTIRVLKGKPLHISILDDARNWVDEKIKPRKTS